MPLWSGQAPSLAREMPAGELIAALVSETEAALRPFATGTPLKIVVRSETTGDDGKTDEKTQVLEVSSVTRTTVDARRLALPAGYTRKDPGMNVKF